MPHMGHTRFAQPPRPREADLIARWRAGAWVGWRLRADDGARYTVLFQGRPGGPTGPDFRDAVLLDASGARVTGDIELHLSPAGWRAHGHSADPRYNRLALHVTLLAGHANNSASGALASGRRAPLVILAAQDAPSLPVAPPPPWPCAGFAARPASWRRDLLRAAGRARFEERVAALGADMRLSSAATRPSAPGWDAADRALFLALAEGLGYGRDRAAMRACGERLAHGEPPDTLLSAATRLGGVERARLGGLLSWHARWREARPLAGLAAALAEGEQRRGVAGAGRALTEALMVSEHGAVSVGRARILAFNVALPGLAAWARATARHDLAALASATAEELAGLPSNQITREMTRQLGLPRLPNGALNQQGAHHIWAHWCREKQCDGCPCAISYAQR